MDSKPKRQLTEQQRANLAAGREKLKTLRSDPDYSKAQKERREKRKQERLTQDESASASASAARTRAKSPSRSRAQADVKSEPGVFGYASAVPTL